MVIDIVVGEYLPGVVAVDHQVAGPGDAGGPVHVDKGVPLHAFRSVGGAIGSNL